MICKDYLANFVIIYAQLPTEELAYDLMYTFWLLGAPFILQFDNVREFKNTVETSVKEF